MRKLDSQKLPQLQLDAQLSVGACELLGALCVLQRGDAVLAFDHGDLAAHGPIEVGELQANGPRTQHHDALRPVLGDDGLAVGQDLLPVGLHPREPTGARARSHDDVVSGMLDLLLARGHHDLPATGQLTAALNKGHAVLLEQVLHALFGFFGHPARALDDLGHVDGHLAHGDAVVVHVSGKVGVFGGL